MNVQRMIQHARDQLFDEVLVNSIYGEYTQNKSDTCFAEVEKNYAAANETFAQLPAGAKELVNEMEAIYERGRLYALRYGFMCGLYAGSRQYFVKDTAGTGDFDELVMQGLFMLPGMERHREYKEDRDKLMELHRDVAAMLEEGMEEHLVSVECAWDERTHYAAVISFYCGYRSAISFIGTVDGAASVRMAAKQLLTEYDLSLISTYDQTQKSSVPVGAAE